MRAPWPALHQTLSRSIETLAAQKRFEAMVAEHRDLAGCRDPATLFDGLHTPGGDPSARNLTLRALVAQAQGGHAEIAVPVMLLALWPGLDALHRRLARHFRSEPELLVSEISARLVRNVHMLDLARVTWVAATLIRNAERDIRRMLRAGSKQAAASCPLPEDGGPAVAGPISMLGIPAALDVDTAAGLLAERLRPAIGRDIDLVLAVAVAGEPQNRAAARLGLGYEAARKRYQRALVHLRRHLEEAA